MNIWMITTKKWERYFFEETQLEWILTHCNDKKNYFIFLKKYQKAIPLESITWISIEILTNEYQKIIELHKKQILRLEESSQDKSLPIL